MVPTEILVGYSGNPNDGSKRIESQATGALFVTVSQGMGKAGSCEMRFNSERRRFELWCTLYCCELDCITWTTSRNPKFAMYALHATSVVV